MTYIIESFLCFFFCCFISSTYAQVQPRIIGGEDASLGEFPYFVQIGTCGGSLVAPGVVLTAAHCFEVATVGAFATIGPIDPRGVASDARKSRVVETIYHPDFSLSYNEYDFMLLKLEDSLTVDTSFEFSFSEDDTIPADGQNVIMMGFGLLKENTYGWPDKLQKVVLQKIGFEQCNNTYEVVEDDIMICAGVAGGAKDSCQGDSGGPLIVRDGNRHVQVGISSWGEGCARDGFPGVYARVSAAQEWIKTIVCDCWGVSSASFCSGFDVSTSAFECPFVPHPNCENVPDYVDEYGDGCDWHEFNEYPGCGEFGNSTGGVGFEDTNGFESCCYCGGGINPDPTISPAPTATFVINPDCEDEDGFVDIYSDRCSWYETNDEQDCKFYGTTAGLGSGNADLTANDACCYCGGGVSPKSAPTAEPTAPPVENINPTSIPSTGAPAVPTSMPSTGAPAVSEPLGDDSSSCEARKSMLPKALALATVMGFWSIYRLF